MWKFVEAWVERSQESLAAPPGAVGVMQTERDGQPSLVIAIFLGSLALFVSLTEVTP